MVEMGDSHVVELISNLVEAPGRRGEQQQAREDAITFHCKSLLVRLQELIDGAVSNTRAPDQASGTVGLDSAIHESSDLDDRSGSSDFFGRIGKDVSGIIQRN